MSFYFLMGLRVYGPRFIKHTDDFTLPQLFTPYKFIRNGRRGGYENQGIDYYQYTPAFDIIKIPLPAMPEMHYFFRPAGELDTIVL